MIVPRQGVTRISDQKCQFLHSIKRKKILRKIVGCVKERANVRVIIQVHHLIKYVCLYLGILGEEMCVGRCQCDQIW